MSARLLSAASVLALISAPALADSFNRISTFPVIANMAAGEDVSRASSAEIISVSEDGNRLIYTDSPLGVLGLIDITDPRAPKPLGNVVLDGEPTTAHIIGDRAFVAVNTSASYTQPSGRLVTVDIASAREIASCDIGGQPDSVAVAPDGSFLAIAVENERDEDAGDGGLPQMPAGFVVKLPLNGTEADCAGLQRIELTGLAGIGGEDPEPEFVDINAAGEIVVTLQENNHIVVIGPDGRVASHFSAGEVVLEGVDTKTDGRLSFTETTAPLRREPDGVKWIDADHFAIANEGDWKGGSRGFSIFRKDGTLIHDSGASLERAIAEIGHYPEKRSRAKGVEIESVEFARYGNTPYLFVVSERASIVAVYELSDLAHPKLVQLLPSGISPEGAVAIPSRNLLATANEADLGEDGAARAHVMLYELSDAPPAYPMLTSAGTDELIGWGALGALAGVDGKPGHLVAASDSVYSAAPALYEIDATTTPARIVNRIAVTRNGDPAQKLDIEGITPDGKGGYWLANEGDPAKLVPHAILNVNAKGEIKKEISLPLELLPHQTRFGAEGVARIGNTLWLAMQREWGDDAKGEVKLLAYDLESGEWGAVRYPLEKKGEGWVGLSEIAVQGEHAYVIERDNLIGDKAKLKKIFSIPLSDLKPARIGGDLPLVTKEEVRDLIPELRKLTNGYVVDKVEGLAFDAAGDAYVVTDNDGVDDSSGETLFWKIGKLR
ncbi:alkaline phosphatase [Haematobacter massiliensis]|uniref:Alkaline phosphatase n=1 Tax=Haematobacter massiliensis TaxID=195105 RepID=A0A086Y5Q1_9RHOB|nr:esterase-like activity of phytase family protein [Haematobacter massiliensis]KFI29601.1 alkaline phosphatase [Haematobacter massiliensis]OWJ73013.1 alkaline phosphatase [Haematobacter massiliensis]OWJ88318.1 alkaline phosphatase [Haematobacter massiliensis]QBJ25674.1 esterase-like activity of phytase family protein [Haematobacter massiliensis]